MLVCGFVFLHTVFVLVGQNVMDFSMKLEGVGTFVLCLSGVGLQTPTWWGF